MGRKSQSKTSKSLYYDLREQILQTYGKSPYFTSLPSERELCEKYSVSRTTVRKGLDLLEEEGKIVRMRGKGAFFIGNQPDTFNRFHSGIGFYNDKLSQGKFTKSKVLLQAVEHASEEIAEKLKISPGDDVFHLLRLRFIDNQAAAIAESYIPMSICTDLIKIDLTDKSLYRILMDHGIEPHVEYQLLEVRSANVYESMYLEIKAGDPLLVLFALSHDDDGRMVEFVVTKAAAYKSRFEFNREFKFPH